MVSTALPRAVLAFSVSILAMHHASAQYIKPTNDTSNYNATTHFTLTTILSMSTFRSETIPLTDEAGGRGSLADDQNIKPSGQLVEVNTTSVGDLKAQQIAYISCEGDDYTGSAINASQLVVMAADAKPDAILFYSTNAAQCSIVADDFTYQSMYTMTSAEDSATILSGLRKSDPATPNTSLVLNQTSYNANQSGNTNGAGGNVLGKSPTTAVAMIILYSITGIITALFLAIIIVGAIRAHRHPERYGPRRVIGRPRQSRAKGIARAMLETLPIVKFGDKEEEKPVEVSRDVELAEATRTNGATGEEAERHSSEHEAGLADAVAAESSAAETSAADGPDVVTTEAAVGEAQPKEEADDPMAAADNGLACSVCIADFVKGEDIRVLPCKHKFHPECIDPWLLNVSGTCPLCRVDLHPTTSHESEQMEYDEGPTLETREAPNVDALSHRNRRSRILHTLNIGRMRHATPEERIEALRRLRAENQGSDSNAEPGGRTGNRFSRRISRAFGGSRPVSQIAGSRPVSEIPPQAAESSSNTVPEISVTTPTATSYGAGETAHSANVVPPSSPIAEETSPGTTAR